MSREHQPGAGPAELRRQTIRLAADDYDRLSALAANEGVAMAVKGRELMLSSMDPQIFGQRYYDVEHLLRRAVKGEVASHSERLHKRLYRVGGINAAMVFFMRDILGRVFELPSAAVSQLWREAEGQGREYMEEKRAETLEADRPESAAEV